MTWAQPRTGFTYRQPDGKLGFSVDDTEERAESSMAFAHKGSLNGGHCNSIEVQKDVRAAYDAGWTIVPVQITIREIKHTHRTTPAYA